jgi:hypothetical protein
LSAPPADNADVKSGNPGIVALIPDEGTA